MVTVRIVKKNSPKKTYQMVQDTFIFHLQDKQTNTTTLNDAYKIYIHLIFKHHSFHSQQLHLLSHVRPCRTHESRCKDHTEVPLDCHQS